MLSAAQKAEYIWADGLEGAPEKVRTCNDSCTYVGHVEVLYSVRRFCDRKSTRCRIARLWTLHCGPVSAEI